jgi:hypothetical protein
MFIVEIYNGTDWVKASEHTQEVDAQNQMKIFKGDPLNDDPILELEEKNEKVIPEEEKTIISPIVDGDTIRIVEVGD